MSGEPSGGEAVVVPGTARPRGNYSHVRRAGDLLFVAGTSSRRPDDTIEGATVDEMGTVSLDIRVQTRAVIENVAVILAAVGAGLVDIVDVTTFLVDIGDFDGYNEVYGEYFDRQSPARTTVAVQQLPHPHLLVEMKVVAYAPAGGGA